MFDAEACEGPYGCGEPLDGESAEYVVAEEAGKPGEPPTVTTAVMHAQCGADAELRMA